MQRATETLGTTDRAIARAARLLAAGGLVAFPTETVYGLGADARNAAAVRAIYAAKGRPAFNPLIVHVADRAAAQDLAEFPPDAERLAEAFWPGPLTLVLPLRAGHGLAPEVTAGRSTVGIRVPQGAVAGRLLRALDGPVAAPSANRSGRVSPTTAAHVRADLDGRIDAVIDGGACPVGVESAIVETTGAPLRLLRAGGLCAEELTKLLEARIDIGADTIRDDQAPAAPGQMSSHYAPRATLRLEALSARPGEVLLGFGRIAGARETLSERGDLAEAAANLFAALRRLDATGARCIAVAPIPETGLGRAINDRLRRAAAPRL